MISLFILLFFLIFYLFQVTLHDFAKVPPNVAKLWITVVNWPFGNIENSLVVTLNSSTTGDSTSESWSADGSLLWSQLNAANASLYPFFRTLPHLPLPSIFLSLPLFSLSLSSLPLPLFLPFWYYLALTKVQLGRVRLTDSTPPLSSLLCTKANPRSDD